MPPFDGKAMADSVLAAVRDYVARSFGTIVGRFESLAAENASMLRNLEAQALITKETLPDAVVEKIRAEWESLFDAKLVPKLEAIPKPKDGTSVTLEELRPLVVEEISNTLALVPKPKDGDPGRDAAHLEIMPAIDESRSYPRGTYAKHANGFWRAFEQTQGMRGWECIVAGVAAVEVTWAHEREFTVSHTLSDGKAYCQAFEIPVAIYRGVFVDGREYHRGDQVSWGAHQWHCNEPTTEKPIEGGKAWTLAVKRGRDGKEGPAGKDRIVKEKA